MASSMCSRRCSRTRRSSGSRPTAPRDVHVDRRRQELHEDADRPADDRSVFRDGSRLRALRHGRVRRRSHGPVGRAEHRHRERRPDRRAARRTRSSTRGPTAARTSTTTTRNSSWSRNGGATWSSPVTVSRAGDRPLYAAPAISPTGDRLYVVYEADTAPWRGADMTSPGRTTASSSPLRLGVTGAPGSWSMIYNGSTDTSAGHNDLRATYPGHDIYQERVGDYVYAAATASYGLSVSGRTRRTRPSATTCRPTAPPRLRRGRARSRPHGRS